MCIFYVCIVQHFEMEGGHLQISITEGTKILIAVTQKNLITGLGTKNLIVGGTKICIAGALKF